MSLSKNTTATLLDLVENRLASIQVFDREDQREVMQLKRCLQELTVAATGEIAALVGMPSAERRRGRRPKMAALELA